MRTAVYIRVSTDDQAKEGFSMPAQREKLLAYIHSQGWELSEIYADEGASAKDTNRPELARLLTDVRKGKIDVVLVYRLDRLTRSVLDLYQLLQEFERYGVRFKSSTEVYDTTTAIGRLFITLVAALAQWERENLAERVKMGMGQMVRERKRPGGPPPYGYELSDGKLVIHPSEAEIVRFMFEQYARGNSPRQIADKANRQGSRGKNGARWSASAVLRLLKNPVYSGALRWNYADSGQRQNPPEEWLVEEAVHPAIIDSPSFALVQKRMTARGSRHPRVLSSSFLFSGLLFCSRCQSPMRGKTTQSQRTNGKRYEHSYYLCKNKLAGQCDAPSIREDRLEKEFVKQLQGYPLEAKTAAMETLEIVRSALPSPDETDWNRQLAQKRQRWDAAYEEGLLPLALYRQKLQGLGNMDPACKPSMESPWHRTISSLAPNDLELLLDWGHIWSVATREECRMLATSLVARMEAEACSPNGQKRSVRLHRIQFL